MSQHWQSFLVSKTELCSVQWIREGSGLQEQALTLQGLLAQVSSSVQGAAPS